MRGFIQRTRHSSKDQKENVNIFNVSAPALLQGLKFYHEFFSFSSSIFLMSVSISSWESIPPISFEYTNIFNSSHFDIFATKYFISYAELTDVAKSEQNDNARPEYAGELPDLSSYDTIFIGSPVWWGDWPIIY